MFEFGPRLNALVLVFPLGMALLTILAFFPGVMSPDTMDQLIQARYGVYRDLHPPIMAAFWRALFFLWNNPGVLFVAHVLLYWLFWWGLAAFLFKSWKKQILVLGIAALPPLWSQTIVVWKDTELTLTLAGAYLLILMAGKILPKARKENNYLKIILFSLSLLLFLYSAAVRENSLPALLPLAVYFLATVFRNMTVKTVFAAALCLCALSLLAADLFDHGFLKARKFYGYQACEIFDIAGVFSRTQRIEVVPDYWKKLNPNLTPQMILRNYTPTGVVPLMFSGETPVIQTTNPDQLRELNQKWLGSILHFPAEFIDHRWNVFKVLMALGLEKTYYPFTLAISPNPYGIENQGSLELQEIIKSYFYFFRNSVLFRGWFYMTLLVGLVAVQFRKLGKENPWRLPALCPALSSFLYGAGYFAYAPAGDFRFLYPTVALFFLSLILTLRGLEAVEKPEPRFNAPVGGRARPPKRDARGQKKLSR